MRKGRQKDDALSPREMAEKELRYWGAHINIRPYSLDGDDPWDDFGCSGQSSIFGYLAKFGGKASSPVNFSALNDPNVVMVRRIWELMEPTNQLVCALHYSGYVSNYGHAELMQLPQEKYDDILEKSIAYYETMRELSQLSSEYRKKSPLML